MESKRNRNWSINAEKALWGAAAGRCEFEGCNRFLGENCITKEKGNYAEKAHIRAVSPGGPRYKEDIDNSELNSADNIMLLCQECHKTIDENPSVYTEKLLKKMKQDHENRVYWMTEFSDVQESFMVGYFSSIDKIAPEYNNNLFCKALISDKKMPSERYIQMIGATNIPYEDGEENYYDIQMTIIEKGIERVIKPSIHDNENVSVFALAPIPLLIKLGEKLSDISNVSVFQCHRNEDKWSWERDNNDHVQFNVIESSEKLSKEIAMNISLSADISEERIRACVGNMPIYKIAIENPNREFVRNKLIVDDFVRVFRKCMEKIKAENPEVKRIHVFAAMPNSLAVRMGMDYMPKTDPILIVYDKIKQSDNFVEALTIGGR